MKLCTLTLTLIGLLVGQSIAQTTLQERIWSTVIYSRYGDRTPYILPTANILTPLGATQMYNAGSRFRERYLGSAPGNGNTFIQGISPSQLESDQIAIVSIEDQFFIASAQAFMQGLYPPLMVSSNATFISGQSQLSNGSNIVSPLEGYQYPQIQTRSPLNLNSIWLMGADYCPSYLESRTEYFNSAFYNDLLETNDDFYRSLQPTLLNGIFSNASVGYLNAYLIFDYLNYGLIHNSSFVDDLSVEDWTRAKILADNWIWATYGNTSASGRQEGDQIRAIAGRTIANRIIQALYGNINTSGALAKMTLLFGGFEPITSFAALVGLASEENPQFFGIPEYGSSMVFELFSLTENEIDTYPASTDLYVRFLFRNGTDDSSELIAYPLFGNSANQINMSIDDFVAGMQRFMISNVGDWCETCGSYSIFCPAFADQSRDDENDSGPRRQRRGLSPAVAGVIGAVVTLVVIGLLVAAAMLFGGARLYRQRTKKRSELNGFKGGEKLASDQDLTIPKDGSIASVAGAVPVAARSHERVGSWELGDQQKAEEAQLPGFKSAITPMRRPSLEEDDLHVSPFADPVKPNDRV